jgi:menaquinone-9 beta-reductase
MRNDFDAIIVGGGLAGLTSAILLSRNKKKVLLIEKKFYPFHKVCGEYVSNEVLPFLKSLGFNPFDYGASKINQLRVSTPTGKNIYTSLDLGGFGLSRYVMDNAMFQLAIKSGAEVLQSTKVMDVVFDEAGFTVSTNDGRIFSSSLVIGSYGKRDTLDKKLNRRFIEFRTGYMGVKYHIKTNYPIDEIGLDNFENGYCGIVKIEEDKYNLCYLYRRSRAKDFDNIADLEKNILFKNPVLKDIFSNAEFLLPQPEVINEISFSPKELIKDHVFMCGDSAGLITPLCGNGMSMSIHSAKILCELIFESEVLERPQIEERQRDLLEKKYEKAWNRNFRKRLFIGRTIQNLFGNNMLTSLSIKTIHSIPPFEKWLIANTHGKALPASTTS